MDHMDIDKVFEIPDTPDRLEDHSSFSNGCSNKESNSSLNNNLANMDCFGEGFRNRSREKSILVSHSGGRRLFSKSIVSALGESNSTLSGRMMTDNNAKYENKHSNDSRAADKGKALYSSQSQRSAGKEGNTVVDLTEQSGRAQLFEKVKSSRASRSNEFREGSLSGSDIDPLLSTTDCLKTSANLSQVKEKNDYPYKVGSHFNRGKGVDFVAAAQPKAGNTASAFLQPSSSPKFERKRLVRNGCISPLNIAKAKQSDERPKLRSVAKEGQRDSGIVASDGPPASTVNIRELIAGTEEYPRLKGKGVAHHPFPSKELESGSMHSCRRSSVTIRKPTASGDANGGPSRCLEGVDGWRTTRNRMENVDLPLTDENLFISRGKDYSCFIEQQNKNELVRRDHRNGRTARNLNELLDGPDPVSCQHVSAQTQVGSQRGHRLGQNNEHTKTANTLTKRQKQGSGLSNVGECSTSAFDDSEIVFLSPSGVPSRSTGNQIHHGVDWSSVSELDEFSPELRNSDTNARSNINEDSGIRARQVEADELLARELQEQLYNEVPGVGVGEIDEHIALAMLQEESLQHASPSGVHHAYHPSGSSVSNARRRTQSRPSQPPPNRRSIPARAHSYTRMARLRGQFPGRSRTLSSSSRNSIFPANMDVDMRMHILEALEAFSDMGVANELLQVEREFNENDYEMLLALDDNNHQHGGASHALINGLPQSTVQTDNLEECSICLEIPTVGQTIRHLPCLHKFHKDCIDPWLSRRTSCPVCKSSIS